MRILLFIYALVLLVACNSRRPFAIDCTITNATQGEMVCLTYPVKHDGIWYKQCDTTYIKNGKFCFQGKVEEIVPASLVFANMDELNIYIAPSNMELHAERNTIYNHSIGGLKIEEEVKEYNRFFSTLNKEILEKQHLIQRKSEEYASAYANNADNAQTLALEFYIL